MSTPITKERWTEIEKRLELQWTPVYFRADGYLVAACMERVGTTRLGILVYVNGYIKGQWYPRRHQQMAEEARRFWRPSIQKNVTPNLLRKFEEILGKRRCKAQGYYGTWTFAKPEWNSGKSFCRHLLKHNAQIEELTADEYTIAKAAIDATGASA